MVPFIPEHQYLCHIYVPYITKIKDLKFSITASYLVTPVVWELEFMYSIIKIEYFSCVSYFNMHFIYHSFKKREAPG